MGSNLRIIRITYPFGLNARVLPVVAPVIISPLTQGNQLVRLTFMIYRLKLPSEIRSRLRELPETTRHALGYAIFLLQNDLSGDVKKLKGFKNRYRLRVGKYRVLFQLDKDAVVIYDFGDRKDIY